ncbi:glutathione S-transferase [Breoghania sp. L-A4]|uniref:glutathione S-transferase family protein n=1 Tax=Breoghania sp. L-A4 TaxID=2304600 RepID=UPI000E35D3B1|nr:glutathione S-transferase [Breoghania sp. L-A4]AXS42010.1 glutathione S-transferase [Breoghania sp. L-A4]
MLTFYDSKGLPNPDRVRIALEEKRVMDQVIVKQVDLWKGEHRTEAFKALNPSVTIPLIVLDDGTAISETTAITEYIDHTYPGISLTGRTPKERAVIHMMQRRGEQQIVDAIGAYFHHATPGFGPEIELNQNKAWGEAHLAKTLEGMRYFNDVLEQQPFIAGDGFSMADITVFTGLEFSETYPKVMVPVECTALLAWRARIGARQSCQGLTR